MDGTAREIATRGEGFLRALRICTEVSVPDRQIANVLADHSPTIQTLWGRCVASATNLIATQNPEARAASRDRLAYSYLVSLRSKKGPGLLKRQLVPVHRIKTLAERHKAS